MRKINAKSIIEKLETEDDREKTSFYLSKRIYNQFKKACGKAPASKVVEELMKQFLEGLKEGG